MKLTRKDFKELVEIYNNTWDAFKVLGNYYDEDTIGDILFKGIDWIAIKAGLKAPYEEDSDFDVLLDLANGGSTAINFREYENGDWDCEHSKDLDKVYDYYFVKDGQEPQMTLFTSLEEFDEFEMVLDGIHRDIFVIGEYYNTDAFINEALEAIGWLGMKIEEVGFENFI